MHYTGPPVVGGVEAVMLAQARAFIQAGYPVTLVCGRAESEALPAGCELLLIPELDSQNPQVIRIQQALSQGRVPSDYPRIVDQLDHALRPMVESCDHCIVHNIFTKHFNLPLTEALHRLIDRGAIRHAIAWCHDFSWTSASSRPHLHPGHPWELLRTYRPEMTYVTISEQRRNVLADMLACPVEKVHRVYNGVDPGALLGLSPEGLALMDRLGVFESDLVILMPVRVTQAKNIEYALHVVAALKSLGKRPRLILTGPPDPHDPKNLEYYQKLKDLRDKLDVTAEMRFVFDSGPELREPYILDERLVGELYRVCDMVFMPSLREGFGMPVLEAGLVGVPVLATAIPAANEIGGEEVVIFDLGTAAEELAGKILELLAGNPLSRFRQRVRQRYTWQAIFRQQLKPLLDNPEVAQ